MNSTHACTFFTPEQNYRVDIFSAYVASVTNDAYIFNFPQGEHLDFIESAIKQTIGLHSNVTVAETDKIITLSTCTKENDATRYVVHGKLVPID